MEKNNTIESKIKKYAALAGGITAVAGVANAQIVHTDINPDTLVTGNGAVYDLDVDNNGVIDFTFNLIVSSTSYTYGGFVTVDVNYAGAIMSPAASGNSMMASSYGMLNVPAGSAIGSSGSFSSTSNWAGVGGSYSLIYSTTSSTGSISQGNFLNTDGFVGLKFQNSGNTHYGWARIEVANDGAVLSVKEYAFESTPNTAINAGETANGPVGIADLENSVVINNLNNQLKVESSQILTNGIINVVSMSGKQVVSKSFNNNSERIDLNDFSSGIYMVNVNSEEGVINKKIYVR
jgi:hypothetical protein